jgi:hypothetical protein
MTSFAERPVVANDGVVANCKPPAWWWAALQRPEDVRTASLRLTQDFSDDISMHFGRTVVAAGVAVREAFVVEPHPVRDRRMEFVGVGAIPRHVGAVLVGFAAGVSDPWRPIHANDSRRGFRG